VCCFSNKFAFKSSSSKTMSSHDVIGEGSVVILQRLHYMRTHKIQSGGSKKHPNASEPPKVQLGKECVDLTAMLGQPYGSAFKMVRTGKAKVWQLEKVDVDLVYREEEKLSGERPDDDGADVASEVSQRDNRHLQDDGE